MKLPEKQLAPLNTVEDLKKILFIQKAVTDKAKAEMLAIATDSAGNPKTALVFVAEERKLLTKYANYPTMSEMLDEPEALMNGAKWGATFGVAILVGGLILEEVKRMQPHLEPVLRPMLMLLLDELNHPRHKYLVEPLEKNMKITSKTAANQAAIKRQVCTDLANAMISVGSQYGVVKKDNGGVKLTPLGRRVFLHMADAERFIQEMGHAHIRLQSAKPKLSLS